MKIAIIGYGGMGNNHRKYIIPRLNDSDYPEKLEIAGIYDISEERKEFAAQLGLHNFDSAEQIFADESIKIVLIATPNDLHKPYALEAMSRGKNVIVEKPMGMNTAKCLPCIKTAAGTTIFLRSRTFTTKNCWGTCISSKAASWVPTEFPASGEKKRLAEAE